MYKPYIPLVAKLSDFIVDILNVYLRKMFIM